MFHGNNDQLVTWTMPKIEVLGDVIDPKEWGTNYNWNYHNGGVAWAMQLLSEATGEKSIMKYASNFCDFSLTAKILSISRLIHYMNLIQLTARF